jgi:hypothetical protein
MANRNLDKDELVKANELLGEIRAKLASLAAGDAALLFAYRRKIAKELTYDERGKPTHRKNLKAAKMVEQRGNCAICNEPLPAKYVVLDRLDGMKGYTPENTRLIHPNCDARVQAQRGYR